MTADNDNRSKALYVLKILIEETDENHPMTGVAMAKRMEDYGFHCNRKTIYTYLDALEEFGLDIVRVKKGTYLGSRLFEVSELQMLVDAVKYSKVISAGKSSSIIRKLLMFTSNYEKQYISGVMNTNSVLKTVNEKVYYNIDAIHEGIYSNVKIRFRYLKWNGDKKLVPKRDGELYEVSPWCFIYEKERYYLLAYDDASGEMKHYRVDKMEGIECTEAVRQGKELFDQLNMTCYTAENFCMFKGKNDTVALSVTEDIAGAIIDHFGNNVWMHHDGKGNLIVVINVSVSDKFYGWLTGFGGKVKIVYPEWVRKEYREILMNCLNETYVKQQLYDEK